jgi:hypothetical protein
MAAGLLNILIEQGATFSRTLTVESAPGTPINLTGYTFAGKMRKNLTDTTAAVAFTLSVSSASSGQVLWTLSATQTDALAPQVHRYDIEMTAPGGTVTRILEGEAWVSGSATR